MTQRSPERMVMETESRMVVVSRMRETERASTMTEGEWSLGIGATVAGMTE